MYYICSRVSTMYPDVLFIAVLNYCMIYSGARGSMVSVVVTGQNVP